jgi:hypothetical protein
MLIDEKNNSIINNKRERYISYKLLCKFIKNNKLYIQLIFSMGMFIFSLVNILNNLKKNNTIYYSIIIGLIGYWIPSPLSSYKNSN